MAKWNTDINDFRFFGIDSVESPNKGTTQGMRRSNFPSSVNTQARFVHPTHIGDVGPISLEVSWFPNNNNVGNIRWRLQYTFTPFDSVVIKPSTNIVELQATPGVQNQLSIQFFEIPEMAVSGGGQLTIHIQRRGVHSTDTYAGTARVVGFCYQRNRIPKP